MGGRHSHSGRRIRGEEISKVDRKCIFELRRRPLAAFLVQGKAVLGNGRAAGLTVAGALDDYVFEHVREHVVDQQRAEDAIFHLKQFFGDLPLSEVDIPKCRGYLDARRAGVIGGGERYSGRRKIGSDSTIRRELGVLQAAANHAARWRRIGPSAQPITPMPVVELPRETQRAGEAPWLPREGIDLMLKASEGQLHHFIKLAYWWAARRGWVERLHADQINFASGRVNPYRNGERVTNKRRGMMPVFSEIRGNLETLVAGATNGFLFGQRADFYSEFRELAELCGYDGRSNPHVLRHSRATHMLMAGESIYKVARLLGDSVQTVERVYGHHSIEFLQEKTR